MKSSQKMKEKNENEKLYREMKFLLHNYNVVLAFFRFCLDFLVYLFPNFPFSFCDSIEK